MPSTQPKLKSQLEAVLGDPTYQVSKDKYPIALDRRQHQRYKFQVPVRFMTDDGAENIGELLDVSISGMALKTKVRPKIGDHVVIYIDELGRYEGNNVRVFDGGFAVQLLSSIRKRRRTADILKWLAEGRKGELPDERRRVRVAVSHGTYVQKPNGDVVPCRVIDISLDGIGLEMEDPPELGDIVQVGLTKGRVIHKHERHVGIEFIALYS